MGGSVEPVRGEGERVAIAVDEGVCKAARSLRVSLAAPWGLSKRFTTAGSVGFKEEFYRLGRLNHLVVERIIIPFEGTDSTDYVELRGCGARGF